MDKIHPLIERYIYAVNKKLPPRQRQETAENLYVRIQSMLGETGKDHEPSEQEITAVLGKLGDPDLLAEQYRQTPRYLIGPALFDTYWLVLRIVLLAAAIGLAIASIVRLIFEPIESPAYIMVNLIGSIYQGMLTVFALVTLVFALLEYLGPDNIKTGEKKAAKATWQVSSLPPGPASRLQIKRSDPIISIIFTLIFMAILNFAPELFGFYWQSEDGWQIVPLLFTAVRNNLLWINLVFLLAIILESIKLATGRWNTCLVLASLAQNALALVVGLRVIRDPDLINPIFITTVNQWLESSDLKLSFEWPHYLVLVLTILLIIGFVLEVITLLGKGYRLLQVSGNPQADEN